MITPDTRALRPIVFGSEIFGDPRPLRMGQAGWLTIAREPTGERTKTGEDLEQRQELTVPVGKTAFRPHWTGLPEEVRGAVERLVGSDVENAESQRSGYTPGFASILTFRSGERRFVKAASSAQRWLLDAYAGEARTVALLPSHLPVPGLLANLRLEGDGESWVILVFEHVEGRIPHRPWTASDATAVIETVERLSAELTPPPDGPWARIEDQLRQLPPIPSALPYAEEVKTLAAAAPDLCMGDTLLHHDLRDDNFLIEVDGVKVCDWGFPVVGAQWIDTVEVLLTLHGDGLDTQRLLRSSLAGAADDAAIDAFLAHTALRHLHSSTLPQPHRSPYLRAIQAWYANAAWEWLTERKAWPGRTRLQS